ncbi:MAG: ABC transporter permease [Eubacteriaceae bacterium]|jgi:peptide/nickel transport system permease protein|nr:ABC transporter permease [Eubacteriaceae bacterium]
MKKGTLSIGIGSFLLVVILLMVLSAPLLTAHDPIHVESRLRFLPMSGSNLMGTDNFGRDIFSRVLYGGRITLSLSFLAMVVTGMLGMIVGILSALYHGKAFDVLCMRTVDVLLAMPFLVVAMAITTFLGRGLDKLLIVVVLMGWASFARLARSLTLALKSNPSLVAARVLGASTTTLVLREILPRILFPMVINITLELSGIILSLSTLSFFGMGNKPPNPEWGSMLSDGRLYMTQAPNMLIWPCVFIFLTVLGLNLLGEGLRDYANPFEMIPLE